MATAGTYIEANGLKVYYEVYGEGEPLLLITVAPPPLGLGHRTFRPSPGTFGFSPPTAVVMVGLTTRWASSTTA